MSTGFKLTRTHVSITVTVLAAAGLNLGVINLAKPDPVIVPEETAAVATADPAAGDPAADPAASADPAAVTAAATADPAAAADAAVDPATAAATDPAAVGPAATADPGATASDPAATTTPPDGPTPAPTTPPTTAATATTGGSGSTPALPTPALPARYLSYESDVVGSVTVALKDERQVSTRSVAPKPGWTYALVLDGPDTVTITFTPTAGGLGAEFSATVVNGELEVQFDWAD